MAKSFNRKLDFRNEIASVSGLWCLQSDFTWDARKSITISFYPETNLSVASVDVLQCAFHNKCCHRCYCWQFSKTELQVARQRYRGMGFRKQKAPHF